QFAAGGLILYHIRNCAIEARQKIWYLLRELEKKQTAKQQIAYLMSDSYHPDVLISRFSACTIYKERNISL
ncbi:hypothetical protein KAW48_09245, partial [candidate division WOR-3 bacterium]|nr:hypothetical protein [candidate division WOR-3 bacterium]